MAAEAHCPRCGGILVPPDLMHSDHHCSRHGAVAALHRALVPTPDVLQQLVAAAAVPAWLPWPLPATWVFTGVSLVGGGAAHISAAALGLTGAALTSGPADLIVVSEQPGTGLGARLAGLTETDPGQQIVQRVADTTVFAGGWPTPMWSVATQSDCAAYVGEAGGDWLWLIAWPEVSWSVIHDDLRLVDLRTPQPLADLPRGALMPRLRAL